MDCPVICIRHEEDGEKLLMIDTPPGDPLIKFFRLSRLTATKVMKELISDQKDGVWARIPVRP